MKTFDCPTSQKLDKSSLNIQVLPSQIKEMPTGGETSSRDELIKSFGFEEFANSLESQGLSFDKSVLKKVTANTLLLFFKTLGGVEEKLKVLEELLAQKSRRSLTFRQAVSWNLWVFTLSEGRE